MILKNKKILLKNNIKKCYKNQKILSKNFIKNQKKPIIPKNKK
jgi:hypothetical protein